MATMRSLGFSIFSRYDGSGVTAARRDIDGFNVTLTRSSGALNSWSGRMILAAKAAAVFGPALLPIAANLTAIAGAATAMAASVGTALAAYGLAMKNAITQTQAMAKAGKTLSAAQKDFISSQNAFNKAMSTFGSSFRDESLKAAAATLKGMTNALKAMEPVARAIAPEITKVANAFERWTKGDSFKNYVNLIKASAVPAFRDLVAAGKDFLNVVGDGFRAFLPSAGALAKSLREGAAALKQWSDGGGFQRFLAYVRETSPAVKDFFKALWDAIKNVAAVMKELAPVSLMLLTAFLRMVAALPPEWISAIVQGFILFKTAMLGLMVIGKLVAIFHALRGAWMLLSLAFAASPLGLVVIAVMAVIAAITLLVIHWDTVSAALKVAWSATWNFMKMAAEVVWNALKIAWAAFVGAFATAWTAVAAAFSAAWSATWTAMQLVATTIWTGLTVAWGAFVNAMALVWTTVSAALSAAWSAVWTAIQLVATTVWTGLTVAWTAFINGLSLVWTTVSAALSAAWSAVWTAIQLVATTVWTGLTTAWSAFINGLSLVWTTVSAALSAAWSAVWTAMQTVASAIWTGLTTAWSAFINGLSLVWTAVSGALSAAWSATWTAIQTVATAIWTALTAAWSAFINGLSLVWTAVSGALSAAWSATWNAISTAAQAIWTAMTAAWNAFINGLQSVWSAVSGALSAAWSATWNAMSTAAQAIWTALTAAWNAFINGMSSLWSAVSSALSSSWSAVWSAMQSAAQAIWSALQAAWQAFLSAAQAAWGAFSAALSAAWNAMWNAISTAARAIWTAMQVAWQLFLTTAQTAWTAFSAAFSAAWNAMWTAIRTFATTIWTALQTAWSAFLTAVRAAYDAFMSALSAAWSAAWTAIQAAAQAVWDAMRAAWQAFVDGVMSIYNTFSDTLKSAWDATWNALLSAARSIWNTIGGVIEKAINGVISIVNGLIKGFNNVASFLQIDVSIGEIGSVNFPGLADGGVVTFAYGGMTGGPEGFANGGTVNLRKGGTLGGYAPGRDTVPAMLSKGEGVLTPEAVRGLGGPGFVNGANRTFAGHRGAGRGAPSFSRESPQMQQFAVGGMTASALQRAGVSLGMVSQGEYSNGALSAGTHAGGGVVDISSTSPAIVAALRAAGFAAWARTGPAWAGNEHIHAILMSHPDLSGPAAAQVADFLAGGDGLGAGGGGGGGIPGWLQAIIDKGAEIISAVAQGKDISNIIGDLLPGGGDNEDGEGLFGTGIGPDIGPDLVPGTDIQDAIGNAVGAFAKFVIPGFGDLGKLLLGLLPDSAFEVGFKWIVDKMSGFANPAGGFGEMAIAMGKKLIDGAIAFLIGKNNDARAEAMAQFAGGGGGDVQQWAGLAADALARAGISASQLPAFLALMQAESGGNPNARNNTDSNARAGIPSQGLMQVIPPTFAAYRDPSLPNNILDPLANMTAAARYIKSRYGGNVPGSPYANGTNDATPGMHLVGERGPELVTGAGFAMFGGGEQVFNAADTAAIMAPPPMPATSSASSSGSGSGGSEDPLDLLQQLIEAAQMMREAVASAWTAAVASGKSGWSGISSVGQSLVGQVGDGIPAAFGLMKTASGQAWTTMSAQTLAAWTAQRDGVYTQAQQTATVAMPLAAQTMSAANGAAWTQMNTDTNAQWGLMRDVTFTEANDFIAAKMPQWGEEMNTAVSTSFENMNTATADSWNGMQEATRAPVNWIIGEAYNNGLARLWNEVAAVIFEDGAPTLPTVATLAKGGPVRGRGSSTSDSIPARLSDGEHVWTAREVSRAGGHHAVEGMRSAVMNGKGVRGGHAGGGFSLGGWLSTSASAPSSLGLPAIGELTRGSMMDEAGPLLDALDSGVRGALAGSGMRRTSGLTGGLYPSDWMRQYIEKDDEINQIGSGGPPWVPGVSDVITSWGGVTVNQRTADMLNMAMALGASFSATQGSFSTGVSASAGTHDGGGVVDLVPASNGNVGALRAVGFAAWNRGAAFGSPSFSPHIHAVALGDPTVSSAAAAQIQSYLGGGNGLAGNGPDNFGGGIPSVDGVGAIAGGGQNVDPADMEFRPVSFDRGGWWKPGTFGYNGTGKPELAVPADDLADIADRVRAVTDNNGQCTHIEFNFNGPVNNGDDVRRAVDEAIPKLRSALQAGSGKRIGG